MKRIGEASTIARQTLLEFADKYRWDHQNYDGAGGGDFWQQIHYKRAFLKIKPGGRINEHRDLPPHDQKTHTVLQTNDQCVCRVDGIDYRLELGGIYAVNAALPHSSWNDGTTDRIHMVETR